jgi:hypothetical protein
MAERHVVFDEQVSERDRELQAANERAEKAEVELARLKADRAQEPAAAATPSLRQSQAASQTESTDQTGNKQARPAEDSPQGSGAHAAHDVQLRGTEALRQDAMMSHLLDSLAAGKDIGHYGRLVFAMVARHFLSEDEVIAELTKDPDFSTDQAVAMLRQVSERDYNPPRRERILEWQQEQEFAILPEPDDPECGNVYRTLHFPTRTYKHIEHYQEERAEA